MRLVVGAEAVGEGVAPCFPGEVLAALVVAVVLVALRGGGDVGLGGVVGVFELACGTDSSRVLGVVCVLLLGREEPWDCLIGLGL